MTTNDPDQEVWITLRLKGSVPLSVDAHKTADAVVKRIETYLLLGPTNQKPSLWQRFFNHTTGGLDFSLCQPAEIIEVEEEVDIYDTHEPFRRTRSGTALTPNAITARQSRAFLCLKTKPL
jgi:hypothetical protein